MTFDTTSLGQPPAWRPAPAITQAFRHSLPADAGRLALFLVLATSPLSGVSTQTWEMNTYADFLKGRFDGVSLTREGRLRLAPRLETVFASDQPAVWSVVRDESGNLFLGTGHRGRVYKVDASGRSEVYWTADEPEVFALALDPQGRLYAATSPNGKIYRLENGKSSVYFAPGATYVWSLAFDRNGVLYAGTGDQGRIYRVEGEGKGEVHYETGQSHVTALALDAEGRLLAGTEPNGILYRVNAANKAFVLYDANLPEIRALVSMSDGSVYAAAMGGSVSRQTAAAAAAPGRLTAAPVAHTSITITAAEGAEGIVPPQQPQPAKPVAAGAGTPPVVPVVEIPGIEKSAVYKVHPDHTVETLWNSTEENAYDLMVRGDRLLFTTDEKGRLYELGPDRKASLLVQTNEEEAIRLAEGKSGLFLATGNMGKVYRVAEETAEQGVYEAPVHDASRVARWGKLSWRMEAGGGASVTFECRTGNSARPDNTWSDWSAPLTEPEGSQIPSPNARYIQWRARFGGTRGAAPSLESVTLAYLPQNAPPRVTGITISSQAAAASAAAPAAGSGSAGAAAAPYSITVTDTGEAGASTVTGTATQRLANSKSDQLQINWQTEDLDGDKLTYQLDFRGEGETAWKKLRANLEETKCTLDSDVLADGKYYFRVVASDHMSNPVREARDGELVSAPVLIDHTPPVVTLSTPQPNGAGLAIDVSARDATSALRRCEYSINAGPWIPLSASDGIIDSPSERFRLELDQKPPGETLVVVRIYDTADNAGLAKVLVR